LKFLTQLFLASLIVVKIVLGSIFIYSIELDPFQLEGQAIASEIQGGYGPASRREGDFEEEETIDLNFLIKKRTELRREEEEIQKKKQELMIIKEEINKKIEKLTLLRNEIRSENEKMKNELKAEEERRKAEEERKRNELRAEAEREKLFEDRKLKHLIQAYSTMKPQQAAGLVEKLDLNFSIELLSAMKGDAAGKILSFVDLEKGARISEGLARRKLK